MVLVSSSVCALEEYSKLDHLVGLWRPWLWKVGVVILLGGQSTGALVPGGPSYSRLLLLLQR